MRRTWSTAGLASTQLSATALVSPTRPRMCSCSPRLSWMERPMASSSARSARTADSFASFFKMMIMSNTPLCKMKGAGPQRKKPGACLLQAPGWVVPAKPMRGALYRPGMFTANQDLAIKSKAIIIVCGKQSSHEKISSHLVKLGLAYHREKRLSRKNLSG